MRMISLQECLGLQPVDRTYHISAQDINPSTGKAYAINPSSGVWDDNYFANNFGSKNAPGYRPDIPNLSGLYDSAYTNNPAVKAAKDAIAQVQSDITTKTKARDAAVLNENDNPFYSEGTRTGRVAKINDAFNNDAQTLNGQLATNQANLSSLQADAERQVNLAQGQYSLENDRYKQNLDEFNQLLSAGGLQGASDQQLAQLSVSTGMPVSMLKGIQGTQNAKNLQIITSTDNAGNLTVAAVDQSSGKIVSTDTLGGVGKAKVGKGGSGGGKVDANGLTKNDYITYLGNDISNGITLKSLVQHYQNYLPVNTIYQQYASNSPLGAPKETQAQVQAGQYADDKGFVSKQKKTIN